MKEDDLDTVLSTCWNDLTIIVPVHLKNNIYTIQIATKHGINEDPNTYTLVEAKKKVLNYYYWYYKKIKNKLK